MQPRELSLPRLQEGSTKIQAGGKGVKPRRASGIPDPEPRPKGHADGFAGLRQRGAC